MMEAAPVTTCLGLLRERRNIPSMVYNLPAPTNLCMPVDSSHRGLSQTGPMCSLLWRGQILLLGHTEAEKIPTILSKLG